MADKEVMALGGGCFWCTEAVFTRVKGVLDVESGYCNGHLDHPDYEQVCTGSTGHVEVVRLEYDPAQVSVEQLLEIFFAVHDPTTLNRQGHDVGTQYRSGIYFTTEAQAGAARAAIRALTEVHAFDAPIVTEVQPLANYWPAEAYHQDFFAQHPQHGYCLAVAAPKVVKLERFFPDALC